MRFRLFVLLSLMGKAALAQSFQPVPIDPHEYTGGWEHFVGGGLAAFDCDGDARLDLYAAGGSNAGSLYRNISTKNGPVAFKRDTPPELQIKGMSGAYPLDIDSDGYMDLVILRVGENRLLKGGPDCRFTQFNDLGFQASNAWTTAFSATWESGQTLPTLAFGNYVDRNDPKGPFETCDVNSLYRPNGDKYAPAKPLSPGFCTLSALFSDWSRTGRPDLRLSNDRHYYVRGGQEQLWAMGKTPRLYSAADGWLKHELWGMGIASRDITGDGRPDVYLTSMGDQRFQIAQGSGPTFKDAAYPYGLTAHRPFFGGDGRPSTGWHAEFGDVQNDGRDDLFVSKGNVEQMPGSAMEDPNNLLVQLPDGKFEERGDKAGIASLARSRGAVLADFNKDGLLDLAVVNRRANMEIYQNTTAPSGHWLAVTLSQNGTNTQSIGTWLELDTGSRVIARELTIGGGHAGGTAGPQHFGLGTANTIRLRAIWPSGAISDWIDVPVDRYITVMRGTNGQLALDF